MGNIGTQGLQFFEQGGCGFAMGIQAHRHRHELLLNRFVVCLGKHLRDVRGQTTRRRIGRDHGLSASQTGSLQL